VRSPFPAPETGSQPNWMEKKRIRMGPRAKLGKDRPTSETTPRVRSCQRLRWRPDACGDRYHDADEEGGYGQSESVGVALENKVGDRVVEAQRLA
jgi:hypothetical protein